MAFVMAGLFRFRFGGPARHWGRSSPEPNGCCRHHGHSVSPEGETVEAGSVCWASSGSARMVVDHELRREAPVMLRNGCNPAGLRVDSRCASIAMAKRQAKTRTADRRSSFSRQEIPPSHTPTWNRSPDRPRFGKFGEPGHLPTICLLVTASPPVARPRERTRRASAADR